MSWLPKKTILVPVDFSPASVEAVRLARSMVSAAAGLHVLHVLHPMSSISPGVAWGEVTEETRRQHVLEELAKLVSDDSLSGCVLEVRIGSPGVEIAEYARSIGAELIVIPSHGYTGLKHLLLGSVAERVLHHATCPVLVLRRSS
jgi:nucleotide-binding universal stress UspA family protein